MKESLRIFKEEASFLKNCKGILKEIGHLYDLEGNPKPGLNGEIYVESRNLIARKIDLKNLNHLILDCLKYKKHPTHFNLEDAIFVHNNLKPKKTILTNLHHDLDYDILFKKLPKNVVPAYDGMKINL